MDISILAEQNLWWKDPKAIEDDYDILRWKEKKHRWIPRVIGNIPLKPFALHILTGPRQAGKTTALKLFIRETLLKWDPQSVFYFNCENLSDFKELTEILETYLQHKEEQAIQRSVIILDEITIPKEWYRAVKYLVDRGKLKSDILIITGSSSIAVKREVELFPGRRGNGRDFTLSPLSFREFVELMQPEIVGKLPVFSADSLERSASQALLFRKELQRHLEKYMLHGGFPLSIADMGGSREEAKKAYLAWIKNTVLKAERSDILARQILKAVVETLQSTVSWEGIAKKIELKSPKTVAAYIDLLRSSFILNVLYNLDVNEKKIRFGKNKKIHIRDPLLLEILEEWCLINAENKQGAIAESLVVEHLMRYAPDNIFFWKNGSEIDALLLDKQRLYGFEVKWSHKAEFKKEKIPQQLRTYVLITKQTYARKPLTIPLAVFLSLFDVE